MRKNIDELLLLGIIFEVLIIQEIRVAMIGVGNCASSLVQGVEYYKNVRDNETVPGLMHTVFADYRIRDIKFVAAFDINRLKIGRDLSEAIFAEPNVAVKFAEVPKLGVKVMPSPILDGAAPHTWEAFRVYDEKETKPVDAAEILRENEADMLLSYLPVGSVEATKYCAEACLNTGCAFVNCIPEFIASSPEWSKRFEEKKIPIAGDDIKSQVGATILHRSLTKLFVDRGVKIDETYQMNIGGDTDFLNMTVEERLKSKRISKTEAVTSLLPYTVPIKIGPSDYVPHLGDAKICYIYIKGRKFGDRPISVDVKLSVEDSPNSGGVVIDVMRAMKVARDRGIGGQLTSMSAYGFKHPPKQFPDETAKQMVEEFIQGKRER
ncbi:MAG: inositol-3-phosphate synthase [Candidatus Bathyarchaeota archaeon]